MKVFLNVIKKSISKKIMFSIFSCTFLLSMLILLVFNVFGNRILIKETTEKNAFFLESHVRELNQLFRNSDQMATQLSSLITDNLDYDKFKKDPLYAKQFLEDQQRLLVNFANQDASIMGVYTYFDPTLTNRVDSLWFVRNEETKVMERNHTETPISDFSPTNESLIWFYGPLKANGLYWTPLYEDTDLKLQMISCTYPLYIHGEKVGMVGFDISNFNVFSNLLEKMKVGESGFAAMIDSDGSILSHPTLPLKKNLVDVENGLYKPLFTAMNKNGQGSYTYKTHGQDHVVSYIKASNGKFFIFDILKSEMFAPLNQLQAILIFVMIASILLALALSSILGRSIGRPIVELSDAANKLALGDIDIKLKPTTQDEVGVLTLAFIDLIEGLKDYVHVAENIAVGQVDVTVTIKSDKDILGKKLQEMIHAIKALVADANALADAATQGHLDARADVTRHGGEFAKIFEGVNRTLDAVIGPLNVAASYVAHIAKGNIPPKITDTYPGDFNELKNNLNICIDAINLLIEDSILLSNLAIKGKLDARADITRHGGDFKKIVQGFNETLDATIDPIKEAAVVLTEMSKGNLSLRVKGDYEGDHTEIKTALNVTLDALSEYIHEISMILVEMANSNLDVGINKTYKGDFTPIKESLNFIVVSLNQILGNINKAADQVASGSRMISSSSFELSQGVADQASAIEELTRGVAQIAQQTRQNAIHANQAKQLTQNTMTNAQDVNTSMQEMLGAMQQIKDSSNDISKIIKIINGIATQTNVLALNASVEAARAGLHGTGFAVVAEEVRSLAAKSALAARETDAIISESIGLIDGGTLIANDTALALSKIVQDIEEATTLVSSIAKSSDDQAAGIAQINGSVEQMSSVTQSSNAASEESAAASEELSGQAVSLKNMVAQFRLSSAILNAE